MAVTSRGRATDLQMSLRWKDKETSPERTKVWTEPPTKLRTKVPVVYYLSRNGHLDQPHFMEVPISSPEGLYLRDVLNRLNFLRGKRIASMYSWSSKRSYKNGFVWHDLAENDFIHPAHGQEYVLKGSELLDAALICKSDETVSSSFRKPPREIRKAGEDCDFQAVTRRRNQSWSDIDFHEYKVYKAEPTGESAAAADASTQTDDKRRRRRAIREIEEEEEEEKGKEPCQQQNQQSTELSRDEVSSPPSDLSPETLESLMEADGRPMQRPGEVIDDHRTEENNPGGRSFKASSVLMQLISCGSNSFKDCSPGYGKGHDHHHHHRQGFSLISHYKARLPRGGGSNQVEKETEEGTVENSSFRHKVKLEGKEYFSGSLIETKKIQFPAMKRSNSYNADRSAHLELEEEEAKGVSKKHTKQTEGHEKRSQCLMRRSAHAQH